LISVGGGSGFIGRHLQKCLRKKGYNVKLVSRHPHSDRLTWVSLQRCWYLQHIYRLAMKSYTTHSLTTATMKMITVQRYLCWIF